MKRYFLTLLAGFCLYACTSPVSPASPDIIPEAKMTNMLIEIHIAEARIDHMGLISDTAAVYYKKAQEEIFKKNKVTEKQFHKSYDYYLHNVSELDKIYAKVVDSLSLKEVEATNKSNKPVPKTLITPLRKKILPVQ